MSTMTAEKKSNVKSTSACRTPIERQPSVDAVAAWNSGCSSAVDANGCSSHVQRNDVFPRVCHRTLCSALECVLPRSMAEREKLILRRQRSSEVHTGEGAIDLLTVGGERYITVSGSRGSDFRVKFSMSSLSGTADGSVSNVCTYSIEPLDA